MNELIYPPRFYPITDSLDALNKLLGLGYGWIQLRNKNADVTFYREAKLISEKKRQSANQCIIINDNPTAAIEYGFDGVHFGQEDLQKTTSLMPVIRARKLLMGISAHDEQELKQAVEYKPSYIALGCLFQSSNKSSLTAKSDAERSELIQTFQKIWHGPRVAIGGIKIEHCAQLYSSGITTVAFIELTKTILLHDLTPYELWQNTLKY